MDMPVKQPFDPPPPQLKTSWVFLLCILTLGLFAPIWLFLQARWIRRVTGEGNARGWAFVYLVVFLFAYAWDITNLAASFAGHGQGAAESAANGGIIFSTNVIVIFTLRDELNKLPLRKPLGVVMTFFFGSVYFQHAIEQLDSVSSSAGAQTVTTPPLVS
jgi:hypothetical protein